MSNPARRRSGPSPWLVAAVTLAHLTVLSGVPPRAIAAPVASPPAPASAADAKPAHPATRAIHTPKDTLKGAPKAAPASPKLAAARHPANRDAERTATAAPLVRVPGDATLRYQVSGRARGLAYQADAELRWRRQDGRYEAQWSVGLPLLGTRTQRSEGAVTASGLAPVRFAEKARSERAAYFDAEGARIRFSANTPDAALQPGAQDRLSITLQLAALLAAAPDRYPPGAQITLQIVGVRDAQPWTWQVLPGETLPLAGQPMPTVKLLRQPRQEDDSRVELWLSRTLQYLPVRLRITLANGDVADQQLSAAETAPAPR